MSFQLFGNAVGIPVMLPDCTPLKVEPVKLMPVRFEPVRVVPVKFALVMVAFVRFAPGPIR